MDRGDSRFAAWQDQRRRLLTGAAAASTLAARRSGADVLKIIRLLSTSDPVVRAGAIKNLAEIGGKDAAAAVCRRLNDPDLRVRAEACRALGVMRAHSAKPQLYDSLSDRDWQVVCAAANALARMGDKSALPSVGRLLRHPGPARWEALRSLNRIARLDFPINDRGLQEARRWLKYHHGRL